MAYVQVAIAGMSVLGAINSGNAARSQANLQAGQSELQATQQDYQGKVERENALETARIIRRAGRAQIGQTQAAYAGAGVAVGEGSAGDVERRQYEDVEHDAYQAILDGNRRARGMQTDAAFARADATSLRAGGNARAAAGFVAGVGSALAGGYQAMRGAGWRTAGPGFSGLQAPAPVTDRSTYSVQGGD